jgi:molybdopterin-guanine dinucleotide biosynthesis protein A
MRGVVLCGGQSRRMGTPKALLPWADGNLLDHAVARLRAAGLQPLCAGPAEWAAAAGCTRVADNPPGAGPLGGIAASLVMGDCFVLAVDMPLLTSAEIALLTELGAAGGQAVVPVVEGRLQPLAAFWPQQLLPALRAYLAAGQRQVTGLLDEVPCLRLAEEELLRRGVEPHHLRGINTPEAYRELRAGREGSGGS